MIQSMIKQVFSKIRRICCAYELLRCLHVDLQIWQFSCRRQTTEKIIYPLLCMQHWPGLIHAYFLHPSSAMQLNVHDVHLAAFNAELGTYGYIQVHVHVQGVLLPPPPLRVCFLYTYVHIPLCDVKLYENMCMHM
jgi:hypothetical protein